MSKSKLNSLDDDSDDEFNAAALVAETEAAYKPQKRGARGRRRTIDNREKANRKDVLEAMIGDPLPQLLGLIEPGPGCVGQTKLTDSWASVSVQQDVVSGKELPSFASTQDEDTATESEDDLPTATGGVLDPPSDTETESESENDLPPPSSSAQANTPSSSAKSYIPKTPVLEFVKPPFPPPTHQQHLGPLPLKSPVQGHNVEVPASINRHLREYQRVGVRFFHQRWAESRGGLVGDDMGLGKTIQTIAFLSAAFQKSGTAFDATRRRDRVRALQDEGLARSDLPPANKKWPTCLVVCPKTVVGNWVKELNTWAYFEYAVYGGDKSEREDCLKDFVMGRLDLGSFRVSSSLGWDAKAEIRFCTVIMAFDTARMNIDHLSHLPWSIVIVDEVHRCKNPNSGTTIALNRFQCRGTAIQNGYKELWTLLDWCSPGRVGTPSQWKNAISVPLAEGQAHRATQAQVSKARLLADRLVNNLLPYFFLRRTKALIADQMPRKFDQAVFCPLAKTQLEVYKRFLDSPDVQLMVRKDDLCDCGSEEKRGYCCYTHNAQGVHWKDLVLKYMNLFVEISNHVILIFPGFKGETDEQRARRRECVKIAFPGQAVRQADMMYGDELCGKWQVLSQLLDTWKMEGDNKVLIFSKSIKILEMLEGQLQRKNLNFCCMDGKTKQEDRPSGMRSLDKFNNDPEVFVFLISTLVGGTGLNMTSANKVVIFDPNWNPAHDLQAMDRAYRFGQKRDVNVYRLLGAGALEELIYARQIYKQQQMHIGYEASVQTRYFEGVQGSKSHQGELFGLKNIFKLHETALATKMIIEKANLAEMNWALANMDSTPDGTIKEHTASAERNLVDFMLDDSPPTSQADRISDILNNAGVAYTHDHQNVLLASHVERNITSVAIAGSKREDGEAGVTLANEGAPEKKPPPIWPPRRKTTAPVDSAPRLEARVEALIEMGLIQNRNSLASFGRDFALMPEAEQRRILTKADQLSARKQLSLSPPFDY
ncbi:SNF2 family N-terminal domain, partial [Rhizoctonia solani]